MPLKKILFLIVYNPSRAFAALKEANSLKWAVWLLLIRCEGTSLLTVPNMYIHNSPMFFKPPFGLDAATYRFYEIFWYGPFCAILIFLITWCMTWISRHIFFVQEVTFRKVFQIYVVSIFVPWLITIPGDYLMVAIVNADPFYFVPFHVTLLTWSSVLTSTGFHVIYNTSVYRSIFFGFFSIVLFVGLGGIFIR